MKKHQPRGIQKVQFSFSFYLVSVLVIVLGYLDRFAILFATILIHEAGHLVMARLLGWKLESLRFFGFGGILTYEGELNKNNKEDLLVSLGGILFNLIFLLLLLSLNVEELAPLHLKKFQYLVFAQKFVILFNLIPLPPLDGSRILSAILCNVFPYKKVIRIIRVLNVVFLAILVLATFWQGFRTYTFLVTFLVFSVRKYQQQTDYLFQRFLLQKHTAPNPDLPRRLIKGSPETWEESIYHGFSNHLQNHGSDLEESRLLSAKYYRK